MADHNTARWISAPREQTFAGFMALTVRASIVIIVALILLALINA